METPCLCPSEGHKHGGRKYEKTSGVHFCQKRGLFAIVNFRTFRLIFLLKLKLFRMLKITRRVIFKIRKSSVTAVLFMSPTMETRKLKLFYFQKEARHRAKKLWTDIFLGNLSLNEGKNFVGLPVLNSRIWWCHVKTENSNNGAFNTFLYFLFSTRIVVHYFHTPFWKRFAVCIEHDQ